ncbi:heme-dependent oxidative N-demethylase family protein [Martelella endophytica]|uniref:DUF3445 domain-containing protein n=1 Tax=Martelella endophytica TaxID=1486262 RepID=A0A0D5LKU8_MAREN|nr:DUF3445 domain-containing protein [Martelella endophytica]AJY44580.1 hypothetical protein TM49_01035 [Martelella endophytica]
MERSLRHMPYGRAYKPFSIGLSQLAPDNWLEPDDELGRYLDEKRSLLAERRDEIFRAEEDSLKAQREALSMLVAHLAERHGNLYRRDGNLMQVAHRSVALDAAEPPLLTAGLIVQDDLAILIKHDDAWHLAAGFIAFPSSWSLADKAGKPMDTVHADVPGFQAGTRNAALVTRIFDNLKPGLPAERFNWSFKGSAALAMPVSKHLPEDPFRPVRPIADNVLRVERQTLTRLPETGAILFTIRIYADPLAAILRHPEHVTIAHEMIRQLDGLTAEERAYKSMADADVDALRAHLVPIAGRPVEVDR